MGENFCSIFMPSVDEGNSVYNDDTMDYECVNEKTYRRMIALLVVLLLLAFIWMWYHEEGFFRIGFLITMTGLSFVIGYMTNNRLNEIERNIKKQENEEKLRRFVSKLLSFVCLLKYCAHLSQLQGKGKGERAK